MYYNPRKPAPTTVRAWLEAASLLKTTRSVNGLMLHIEDPCRLEEEDEAVLVRVDGFLREHGAFPISTISNTIFPIHLLRQEGASALYADYLRIYPKIKKACPDWGRYFHRMIAWPDADNTSVNQLQNVIDNLRRYSPDSDRFISDMFEITLFDPKRDANKYRARQCLSFLEFKPERLDRGGRLHMMAVYRSHYYIAKTLGNLIGLGRLQAFVAKEANLTLGSLTIMSTYAKLDLGERNEKRGSQPWGIIKARALIGECEGVMLRKAA